MPTRILKKKTSEKPHRPPAPTRTDEWKKLLHEAIKRADAIGDKRLTSLHGALRTNTAEKVLRNLGIIHKRDIEREFPLKSS